MRTRKAKIRGDRGHRQASDIAMRLLLRFWAGDRLQTDDATGSLYLVRSQPPEGRYTLDVSILDELERDLGYVHTPDAAGVVRLTYRGKAALAAHLRRARPDVRAAWNAAGGRLVIRED